MENKKDNKAGTFLTELARSLCWISNNLIKNGRYREAKDVMLAAVLIDCDNARTHVGLGVAHRYLEDKRSARRELESALALDPDFTPGLAIMGEFCLAEGEIDKAIEYFERDLAVLKGHGKECSIRLIETLCKAYIATGNRAQAKKLIDGEIEEHPGDENYLHLRVMLRLR